MVALGAITFSNPSPAKISNIFPIAITSYPAAFKVSKVVAEKGLTA